MGFIRDLFRKKKNSNTNAIPSENNQYITRMFELLQFMDNLLQADKYIARSEYQCRLKSYQEVIDFFTILKNSGMLISFCKKNGIKESYINQAEEKILHFDQYIDEHNDNFIKKTMVEDKEYLDNILKAVDPNILLDEDQRRVILTDEDYCLVIAGAGAGKTTTVAAKVKYLVERNQVDPSQILVVSFTNKAVIELREKINEELKIGCPIATFHSTGNAIIHKNEPDEKLNIVEGSKLYFVIRDYFRGAIMQNENIVNKLIMFFASYFEAPYEGDDLNVFFNQIAKANFSTMRSDLEDFKREVIDTRTKKSVTILNEVLRSHQEVEIANFLKRKTY